MADVSTTHPQYDDALPLWQKCRDMVAGQEAVHAAGELYLPRLAEQSTKEYEAYKSRALVYNATGRTLDGLTGLIFRRPPTIDLPESADYLLTDVNTSGTPLLTFCEQVVDDIVAVGRVGMLADYPPMQTARTMADERAAGARPYVTMYRAESIVNWRCERAGNRNQLSLVVLSEMHSEPDGYAMKEIPQLRVLQLVGGVYSVEIWRKRKDQDGKDALVMEGDAFIPKINGRPMSFIPFLICGPMGVDHRVSKPPLLDLVNVNFSHYMTTADYEHGLHFTGLPTPIITGHQAEDGAKFALGSSVVHVLPNADAKAFFLEFSGSGLEHLSKRLAEKEAMMASLGARMLAPEKRQAEAAETAAIHRSGENSVLASLAMAAGAAISTALTWCLRFAAIAQDAKVELNTDYLPAGMTAQEMTELVKAWQSGAISYATMYDNLQRGEIARHGVTAEEEKALIEAEGPALGGMTDPDNERQ
jgi:hypothetical protein